MKNKRKNQKKIKIEKKIVTKNAINTYIVKNKNIKISKNEYYNV